MVERRLLCTLASKPANEKRDDERLNGEIFDTLQESQVPIAGTTTTITSGRTVRSVTIRQYPKQCCRAHLFLQS